MLRPCSRLSKCCLRAYAVPRRLQSHSFRGYATTTATHDSLPAALLSRARMIASEHLKLTEKLTSSYDIDLAKKAGELSTTAEALKAWEQARTSLQELHQLLADPNADSELRSIASEEIDSTTEKLEQASSELKTSLLPVHPFAHLPCLLELRPGAGGNEAAIFAGDLLRMYQAFCKRYRLQLAVISLTTGEGLANSQIQEAVLEIEGEGAYGILRCEAGVHRVQRVPQTETKGRTHTSAVSVVILPNFPPNAADSLGAGSFDDPSSDYYIDPKDVRTDVMRAKGAGGQHVNTTDSAVRLTHAPTGTVVSMQDNRSQHKNREKAWTILRSRIAQGRREAREEEMAQMRRSAGASRMGRGDKIRTYNWGQQRVTDHRSGLTLHSLDDVMEGGMALEKIMQSVKAWMTEQELEALTTDDTAK